MEYRSVYITAGSEAEARAISRILVTERLAACANYFPVRSIYRWQGKVEEGAEFSLIVKTRAELVEQLIARVKEVHSDRIPCIVAWSIDRGNPKYLDWIAESTNSATQNNE